MTKFMLTFIRHVAVNPLTLSARVKEEKMLAARECYFLTLQNKSIAIDLPG